MKSQSRFAGKEFISNDKFGGSLCKKRLGRKARPVSTKETMHLILKSSLAKGALSFRANQNHAKIDKILKSNCAKFGVKLIKYSNNYNHLHLQLKFSSRELYKRFVRSISGHIAMAVTGACRSKPLASIVGAKSFWDARPYSRIARGRRGFNIVKNYVRLNQLEADGIVPKRDERLKGVRPSERRYFQEPIATENKRSSTQRSFELH